MMLLCNLEAYPLRFEETILRRGGFMISGSHNSRIMLCRKTSAIMQILSLKKQYERMPLGGKGKGTKT